MASGGDYWVSSRPIRVAALRTSSSVVASEIDRNAIRSAALADINIPVISHEVGQWAAYPDYNLINDFEKAYLQPGNFEIFRNSMAEHGLLEKNGAFANASGRFQLAAYKEDIEANLRTPGLSGFQLLDLRRRHVGQQFVVAPHQLIGDRHQLAEHLSGSLRDAHVVAI